MSVRFDLLGGSGGNNNSGLNVYVAKSGDDTTDFVNYVNNQTANNQPIFIDCSTFANSLDLTDPPSFIGNKFYFLSEFSELNVSITTNTSYVLNNLTNLGSLNLFGTNTTGFADLEINNSTILSISIANNIEFRMNRSYLTNFIDNSSINRNNNTFNFCQINFINFLGTDANDLTLIDSNLNTIINARDTSIQGNTNINSIQTGAIGFSNSFSNINECENNTSISIFGRNKIYIKRLIQNSTTTLGAPAPNYIYINKEGAGNLNVDLIAGENNNYFGGGPYNEIICLSNQNYFDVYNSFVRLFGNGNLTVQSLGTTVDDFGSGNNVI
jgi:hypothetical protein